VMTYMTALEWAARLRKMKVEDFSAGAASSAPTFINKFIEPLGIKIGFVGEEILNHCMVFTQRAPFRGYRGMPTSEIPQFVEGEKEELARSILVEHGVCFRYLSVRMLI